MTHASEVGTTDPTHGEWALLDDSRVPRSGVRPVLRGPASRRLPLPPRTGFEYAERRGSAFPDHAVVYWRLDRSEDERTVRIEVVEPHILGSVFGRSPTRTEHTPPHEWSSEPTPTRPDLGLCTALATMTGRGHSQRDTKRAAVQTMRLDESDSSFLARNASLRLQRPPEMSGHPADSFSPVPDRAPAAEGDLLPPLEELWQKPKARQIVDGLQACTKPDTPEVQTAMSCSEAVPDLDLDVGIAPRSDHNFYVGFSESSAQGLFYATYLPVPVGTQARLSVHLPNGIAFAVQATAEWIREVNAAASPGVGFRFDGLGQRERKEVSRFMKFRDPIFYAG